MSPLAATETSVVRVTETVMKMMKASPDRNDVEGNMFEKVKGLTKNRNGAAPAETKVKVDTKEIRGAKKIVVIKIGRETGKETEMTMKSLII